MKKFSLLITALLLTAIFVWAQKVMVVHSGGSVVYEIPTAQVDSVTFRDSEYLTLKMHETQFAPNSNNTIAVSFLSAKEGRCRKSQCYLCWGSFAYVFLSVTGPDKVKGEIYLDIVGCVDELYGNESGFPGEIVDTLGYRFRLVKLEPYPDTYEPIINYDDYTAKIKITKL